MAALKDYVDGEDFPAYGLILCDSKTQEMVPAVYVSQTDTLYWETAAAAGLPPWQQLWPVRRASGSPLI